MSLGQGITRVGAVRFSAGGREPRDEEVVVEAPLELRIAGDPLAVTMRTPGEDRFLALGFLYAEGIISGLGDVGTVAHCGRPGEEGYGHTLEITPAGGARLDLDRLDQSRRAGLTTSACGVCGRASIQDLLARLAPVPARSLPAALLAAAPTTLAAQQPNFARTGGLHAAAALDLEGAVIAAAEDIGRHNAVDKVVGKLLYATQLPRTGGPVVLAISGRASFEMVQKAAIAGFSALVSVSAPSSLAIDTATATGVTLAGFARDGRFTIYAGEDRVG